MAENRHPDVDRPGEPAVRPERSEVNARALTKLAIAFVLGGIATYFLVWFVFDAFLQREAVKGPPPSQGLDVDAKKLPPMPRLQISPIEDLARMRAAEKALANQYAWADQAHTVARIPVSRAMDLVLEEGLPSRNTPGSETAGNVVVPTESGLGPIMTQVGGPLSPNRVFPPPQPEVIHGDGNPRNGRQAGGEPTPPDRSLARFIREPAPPAGQQTQPTTK